MEKNSEVNQQELLVLDQIMSYLRECHSHQMTLTGRVVAFNVVALAAYGFIFDHSVSPVLSDLQNVFIISFGVLVLFFGVIFNFGAYSAHVHLLETEESLKKYINADVTKEILMRPGYNEVMNSSCKGKVAKFTKIFFFICALIWMLLGVTIILPVF